MMSDQYRYQDVWEHAISYPDDLKVRTVYQVLPDESAARSNYIRVIDETGEDYLYPAGYFAFIDVPPEAAKALMRAASNP